MSFRTEISVQPITEIDFRTKLLTLGSCFAESMGKRLADSKFEVTSNPFGIIFNPISIAKVIRLLAEGNPSVSRVVESQGLFASYDVHSDLSATSLPDLIKNYAGAMQAGSAAFHQSDVVFITLGTAWGYERDGEVVANCHKVSDGFTKRLLSVEEIVLSLKEALATMKEKRVVFTVSPVRHWKDGAHENQLSKSTLLLAINELISEQVMYFPSYELVMDDLRDYRFFEKDMLHINEQGLDYINRKFEDAFLSTETKEKRKQLDRLIASCNHRPFNVMSEAHQTFLKKLLVDLQAEKSVNLSAEISAISRQII